MEDKLGFFMHFFKKSITCFCLLENSDFKLQISKTFWQSKLPSSLLGQSRPRIILVIFFVCLSMAHYTALYRTLQKSTKLYYNAQHCTMVHHIKSLCTIQHNTTPHPAVLHHFTPHLTTSVCPVRSDPTRWVPHWVQCECNTQSPTGSCWAVCLSTASEIKIQI